MSPEEPSLFAGRLKDKFALRVIGNGKSHHSPALLEAADQAFRDGADSLTVDLETCGHLDSTFIGTLVGLAVRLRQQNAGQVALANVNGDTCRQLEELGLTSLFALEKSGSDFVWAADPIPTPASHTRDLGRCVMQAHENLIAANPENAQRFAVLQRLLLHELQAQEAVRASGT